MLKQLFNLMVFGGLIFMSSTNLMAQDENAPKSDAPLQVEEVRQLREAAKAINQILSGEDLPEESQATNKVAQKKPTKTPAEVADKALTILSGYIGTAAKTMEKVAPEVWRVMIRQQYAKAIAAPFFAFSMICFTAIYTVVMKRWWRLDEEDKTKAAEGTWTDNYGWHFIMTNALPFLLVMIFGIRTAWCLSYSTQILINPEYYAFSDLLQLLLNKGMVK